MEVKVLETNIVRKAAALALAISMMTLAACSGMTGTPEPTPTSSPILYQGCPVTPIQHSLFEPDTRSSIAHLPWVQALPLSSKITGHLFYTAVRLPTAQSFIPLYTGGKAPNGSTTKILWVVEQDSSYLDAPLNVTGTELSPARGSFHQTFTRASGNDIPSIIDVPSPGCWQLKLVSGPWTGAVVFWVDSA